MNAVIANKYKDNIKGLGIEIVGILEGEFSDNEIIEAFRNFYYEKLILDITSIKGHEDSASLIISLRKIFTFLDPSRAILVFENVPQLNNNSFLSKIVAINLYNYTFDLNEIKILLSTPKTYQEVASLLNYNEMASTKINSEIKGRIIGVKNVTSHAGATTLIYIMYQELIKNYRVKCLEIDKEDFKYFVNEDFKSIKKEQFMDELLKLTELDAILVDVNDYENEMFIKEVLYLIEPSVLKLNKLLSVDKNALTNLNDKKIILNRTSISLESVKQFENESKLKAFDIIRNVNERDSVNPQIMNLLIKLGFNKTNGGVLSMDDTEKRKTLFDSFK